MKAGYFVLRKTAARRRWGGMSKKGKKELGDEELSENEKLEDEVIGVETESESDSEEDERKMKRSGKKEEEEARQEVERVAEAKMKDEMEREKKRQEAKEREEAEKKAIEEAKDKVEQEAQEQVEEKSQEGKNTLTKVVLVSAFVYDGTVQRLEYKRVAEDGVDEVIGYGIGMASWPEEGDEKMTMNEGGDVRCVKEVILEESEEEAEHGVDRIVGSDVTVTSQLVEEKEMGIPDPREDARRDEDVVLKRKEDMLREEKGMSKILKELTEKDGTSPRSSQEQAVEIEELESQLLGNFIERMATPPGIPAVSSLASTKHARSCYSTTITASRGYYERRGCDGGTTILISMGSSSSVGCSPSIPTTTTEDSCPLKEKSQTSRGRREGSAYLSAGPTS